MRICAALLVALFCLGATVPETLDGRLPSVRTLVPTDAFSGYATASATLDFADPAANTCAAALTITLAGAAVGDPVILGIPSTITIQTSQFFPTPVVTATNTVTIKFCEGATVTNNPAAGTFKVTVIK